MTTVPTELRSRIVASSDFDPSSTIVLVADDTNADVELQVFAPGMTTDEFTKLHNTILTRLNLTLICIDDHTFIEVIENGRLGNMIVAVNDPQHKHSAPTVDIVLRQTRTIVEATHHAAHRRVFTLRELECLVLVDWNEPLGTRCKEFTLSLPAEGTGLDAGQCDLLSRRIEALCDRGIRVSMRTRHGADESDVTVEIALWSIEKWVLDADTARAHVARALFVLGTLVRLSGVNLVPVVELTRPFTPVVDDGS